MGRESKKLNIPQSVIYTNATATASTVFVTTQSPIPTTAFDIFVVNSTNSATSYAAAATAPGGGVVVSFSSNNASVNEGFWSLTGNGLLAVEKEDGEYLSEDPSGIFPIVIIGNDAPVDDIPYFSVCNGLLIGNYIGETNDVAAACNFGTKSFLALGEPGNFTGTPCQVVDLHFTS